MTKPSLEIVLCTRAGCHLCEEALEVLQRFHLRARLVDIDSDPALQAKYTNCVPVVTVDGIERFRGRVNEVLLRRLLRGS